MLRTVAVLALLLPLTAGCSSKAKLNSVTGKVTLDGKPVAGVIVGFWPADPGAKLTANNFGRVVTNESGEFSVTGDETSGFATGEYRISCSRIMDAKGVPQPDAKPGEGGARETLSEAYTDPARSGLTATVLPPATALTLELKTAGMPPPPAPADRSK